MILYYFYFINICYFELQIFILINNRVPEHSHKPSDSNLPHPRHGGRRYLFLPRRFLPALPPRAAVETELRPYPEHGPAPRHVCRPSSGDIRDAGERKPGGGEAKKKRCGGEREALGSERGGGAAATERLEELLRASEGVDRSWRWTAAVAFAIRMRFAFGQFPSHDLLARSVIFTV